jgi:hypothetical protein
MIRAARRFLHVATNPARVEQTRTSDLLAALLFVLLYLVTSAWLDERDQRGYWQAEASRHLSTNDAYKAEIDFAVFRDGTCLHREVRREYQHAARVNCEVARQFIQVAK